VANAGPDLVLLELMLTLGDITGREVLQRLKANPVLQHLPVIIVSPEASPKTITGCLKMGAEDFVPTPFTPTQLLDAVSHVLAQIDHGRRITGTSSV
jgi:cyclic di-GMP phosphodiesterase